MTIQNDVVLWDNGIDKFYLYIAKKGDNNEIIIYDR